VSPLLTPPEGTSRDPRASLTFNRKGSGYLLEALQKKEEQIQQDLLEIDQEFRALSSDLAEVYLDASAQVIGAMNRTEFLSWSKAGRDIVRSSQEATLCALEYFKATPDVVQNIGIPNLKFWIEYGKSLALTSPQAAAEFFRVSPTFLEEWDIYTLKRWAQLGEGLLSDDPKSVDLLIAYLKVGPDLLKKIDLFHLPDWVQWGNRLARYSAELALCYVGKDQIESPMSRDERQKMLLLTEKLAESSPEMALRHFQQYREHIEKIDQPLRVKLLDFALLMAKESPEEAAELLSTSGEILAQVEPQHRGKVIERITELAEISWRVAFTAFTFLPHVLTHVLSSDIEMWFERGLDITHADLSEGDVYFRIESPEGRDSLQRLSEIIHLKEVADLLRLYVKAMVGRVVGIRSTDELPEEFRVARHLPTTDGESIFLPDSVYQGISSRENFEIYKVYATHQAGYFEFGTFQFRLGEVIDLLYDLDPHLTLEEIASASELGFDLEFFFGLFTQSNLARSLFRILEDGRIDQRVRLTYKGLRRSFTRLIESTLQQRPLISELPMQDAALESLFHLSMRGSVGERLPFPLEMIVRNLSRMMGKLWESDTTVHDTARVVAEVYDYIVKIPNIPVQTFLAIETFEIEGEMASAPLPNLPPPSQGEGEVAKGKSREQISFRGEIDAEEIQKKMKVRELKDKFLTLDDGTPLSAELLKKLLEQGAKITLRELKSKKLRGSSGFYITDLEDRPEVTQEEDEELWDELVQEIEEIKNQLNDQIGTGTAEEGVFLYDEWDYLIGDYRPRWCHLREKPLEGDSTEFADEAASKYAELIASFKKQFQMIRSEMFKRIKKLEHGEEIDLDLAIESILDKRSGVSPSEKVYYRRSRKDRDVATLFLLDMSASTDEKVGKNGEEKRVIDVEKEALVIMAEALDAIGDGYAIYGFSGHGREKVELFPIKGFDEKYDGKVKERIGAVKPQKSTRMGPAIRHAVKKLGTRDATLKSLILLSDGYPQDFDYGKDRTGREYGINDTMMALREAEKKEIRTFCITVDPAGKDYLRKMLDVKSYAVIDEILSLPGAVPKIYRRLTT